MNRIFFSLVTVLTITLANSVFAAPISPTSYDTINGHTGSFQYWDETYTGAGCTTCNGAPLTGGKGDLTDGIIATDNWNVVEAPAGNGPYVGWLDVNPLIKFHFASGTSIDAITIYVDDADGFGGVMLPGGVTFSDGTTTTSFLIAEQAGANPKSFTFAGLGLTGGFVEVTFTAKDRWVFVSEVAFDGSNGNSVPEPGSLLLFGTGLIVAASRRRRAK